MSLSIEDMRIARVLINFAIVDLTVYPLSPNL